LYKVFGTLEKTDLVCIVTVSWKELHTCIPTSAELMTFSKPFGNVSMTSVKERPRFLATEASVALVLGIPSGGEKRNQFWD